MVTVEMENGKKIEIELYKDKAPNSCANFLSLVDNGFYDGLIFHRVISGFMIQGGCPNGMGNGGPGYSIEGEFKANGFENDIIHERGVLSMARAQDMNSAGSQFFLMHKDSPHLDGSYAAFGKVSSGMDVVDEIAACHTAIGDKPVEEQKIKKVSITDEGEIKEPKKV